MSAITHKQQPKGSLSAHARWPEEIRRYTAEAVTMKSNHSLSRNLIIRAVRELTAILCIGALMPCSPASAATQTQLPDAPSAQAAAKIPADQLDSLVAPIALYPDPLLSQTLVASTYPLEVVQLQQWLAQK